MAKNPGSAKNLVYGVVIFILGLVVLLASALLEGPVGAVLLTTIFGAGILLGLLSLRDANKTKGITVLLVSAAALVLYWLPFTNDILFGLLTGAGILGMIGGAGLGIYGYMERRALPGRR